MFRPRDGAFARDRCCGGADAQCRVRAAPLVDLRRRRGRPGIVRHLLRRRRCDPRSPPCGLARAQDGDLSKLCGARRCALRCPRHADGVADAHRPGTTPAAAGVLAERRGGGSPGPSMSLAASPTVTRAAAATERIMAECVARTRRNGALAREIDALRARAFHQLADRWEL